MSAQPAKTAVQLGQRDRLPEIQLVRAIAIVGVLCVHSTSNATVEMTNSGIYWLYNFINIMAKFGTPTFIFLSSFVLFYNYIDRPIGAGMMKSFYRKRAVGILLPYLLFSILYSIVTHVLYYSDQSLGESLHSFIVKLLTGKAYTHLYFVFINAQFYILFPLVLWLFQKRPRLIAWSIPIGLAIQWGFVLMNKYGMQIANKGSWSPSYFSYYMLGAFIGIQYPRIKQWLSNQRNNTSKLTLQAVGSLAGAWLAAGLAHVWIWYEARLYHTQYNSLLYEGLWNAYSITSALVLLGLAALGVRFGPQWLVRVLTRLGALSFGIYLLHPLLLLAYRHFPLNTGNSMLVHLWYAGGFTLALFGTWIIVGSCARWLPFASALFGQLPAKPKKKAQADNNQTNSYRVPLSR
ncbi:peptidoglycan/LPS O-acetylase OafA/YrhL [Paenibacillus cellulosilyticus]|uniref:Peptidoglycan/LPS O-acetylase OafA/YrhL n=1 Tax=Paenibacillus cellulosilyticus TaxID=375489 RepID=A0A2V2YT73_9BACL|nr:acyltransferase [Paenibacillus cellulosilyticus]PWW00907.1 peptidoglycan/LPS O-acetylase OafA/YrhL [Paenibacillus cellulosilyticus]QKS47563.1 acyltransferase [Paenibacillus cellulosilyticus]